MSDTANVGKVFNLTGGGGGSSALTLESLAVTTPPTKTTYKSGESFTTDGMVVTATYTYGVTAEVTGYTVSPTIMTDDVTEVTVTYTERRVTKTATIPVTVEKVLSSIAVTTAPTKTAYSYLESFDPSGMVVTATYSDGSTEAVTDYTYTTDAFDTLGTTRVEISYTYDGVTMTVKQSVTVSAIEVSVPIQNGSLTYTGSVLTPSWTGYDSSYMTIGGTTEAVNAGSYTARFSLDYGYVFPDDSDLVEVTWTVDRASIAAVPAQVGSLVADGTAKTPVWDDNYDVTQLTISGERYGTEAGEYTATFTPTSNYQWWDGTTEAKSATWVIVAVAVTIPSQSGTLTYTGAAQTPTWNNYDEENSSVSVTAQTDAGTYEAVFTLLSGMWEDGTTDSKTVYWTIGRATISAVPAQSGTLTYDGNPKTPSWDSNYDSSKMTVSVESMVNAGDYEATFTPTSNYQWSDGTTTAKTVTWTISKTTISTTPSQSGTLTYSGSAQSPSWSNYSTTQLTIGGTTSGTNAGSYSATFTPTSNYQWSDGTSTAKTVTWTISKATGTLTASVDSITLNSDATSATFTVGGNHDGTVSVSSDTTSVATVSLSGTTVTVNSVDETTGTATITISCTAGTNYTAPASITVAVTTQFVTIYGVEWDWSSGSSTTGTRTDAAANFSDPSPAVSSGTGSSPFDDLYPWCDMVKETRTGGVMVKEPKYYYKWTKTDSKLKLQIADGPVDGFNVDPVNMDRSDGVGELDYSYIGRYHCATSTYKSTTGVAQQVSITRSTARTNIHNLGSYIWQMDFAQMWYVGMLFLVEFADWNGERIGRGCSSSGSVANNGQTDSMTYHTGTTASSASSYGFTQYRYIEGWWDNVFDWMDGCYYNSNGLNVILNPNNFSDSANGTNLGTPTSGYPSAFTIPTTSGYEWALFPSASNGSTSTYVPDYWYYYSSNPCLRHGGCYDQGQDYGPFYVYYGTTSNTNTYIGCRLQERPPKAS